MSHIFLLIFTSFSTIAKDAKERKKIIKGEAKMRKMNDKTVVDFEDATISGSRRAPVGAVINQNEADKDYEFIKIRKNWHEETINSAKKLP